jgi:membrane-bound serine protease (ClpP class)
LESSIRRLTTTCLLFGVLIAELIMLGFPAHAQTPSTPVSASALTSVGQERGRVDVIEVSGQLDPILVDFVVDALRRAEREQAEALVIQLNSSDSVVSDAKLDVMAFLVSHAEVPVAVWVGPNRARAHEGAARLVSAAAVTGMAPGTWVGATRSAALGPTQAIRAGAVDIEAPTLRDFIASLDGRQVAVRAGAGTQTLETAEMVITPEGPRPRATVSITFAKPGLVARLLHTVASPPLAYLLLVVGLSLIVFEFFTAGVGVAGGTGAGCLMLAAYGLAVLPTRPVGVALVVIGIVGYAVDVQVGVPRAWTLIGTACLALGSGSFYDGLSVGWAALGVVMIGMPLFMVAGMPAMIRARFSTRTIGRESMVGEMGTAVAAVAPDGVVRVQGGLWRARTNRATPIAGGEPVRVVAVDGLVLEVEPKVGGARDAGH